jgi:glutamate 5-kinase
MHYYETLFQTYGDGLHAAQVLVTAGELDDRTTYLNVRNTLHALFGLGNAVPIVNENDSVATEELRFGDNDTLAARVAAGIGADLLVVLSDIDGLYDQNPRRFPEAKHIPRVDAVDDAVMALAEDTTTETSIGGMRTKLLAARIATASGIPMAIADGRRECILDAVLTGTGPMTWFAPGGNGLSHRKRWIAFGRAIRGTLTLDEGACRAVREKGRSLLPAGIAAVSGQFDAGDAVQLAGADGVPFAQGLTNYARPQLDQIIGRKTTEIAAILGRKDFDEVIHRDNMVLI